MGGVDIERILLVEDDSAIYQPDKNLIISNGCEALQILCRWGMIRGKITGWEAWI